MDDSQRRKKKILIFIAAYYPKFLRRECPAVKEITDRMPSDVYEFHMVTNRFDKSLPREEKIGAIFVHRIGITKKNPAPQDVKRFPLNLNTLLFQPLAALKAHRLNKKHQFNAVWAVMSHTAGFAGSLFNRFHPKIPFILSLEDGDPSHNIERMTLPIRPFFKIFMRADAVHAVTRSLAHWAVRMGYRGQPSVIPNAIDPVVFESITRRSKKKDTEKEIIKKEGDVVLLTISHLTRKSGIDTIIRALTFLPSHIRLAILGKGPHELKLKWLVRSEKVEDRVQFLGDANSTTIPIHLAASDIFVYPAYAEGVGNVHLEAMAAGVPVIATQEGGVEDFLFDDKLNPTKKSTGFAVPKGDPRSLAERVLEVIGDPEKTKIVTKEASRMVREKYTWDSVTSEISTRIFNTLVRS